MQENNENAHNHSEDNPPMDAEAVQKLRAVLEKEGYNEISILKDTYINRVLSVPGRTFDKACDKLRKAFEWRREFKVDELDPKNFREQLASHSMYWYGRDITGHPILWLISSRKDYHNIDVEKEIQMVVWLAEIALKNLPEGIDTFTLINVTSNIGMTDFSIPFFKGILNVLMNGYPDRMHRFYAGPTNYVVQLVYKLLAPFLPSNLTKKVVLMKDTNATIEEILKPEEIPDYYNGPLVHPNFVTKSSNRISEKDAECIKSDCHQQVGSSITSSGHQRKQSVDINSIERTDSPMLLHPDTKKAKKKAHSRKPSYNFFWGGSKKEEEEEEEEKEIGDFDWQKMMAEMKRYNAMEY